MVNPMYLTIKQTIGTKFYTEFYTEFYTLKNVRNRNVVGNRLRISRRQMFMGEADSMNSRNTSFYHLST